MMVLRSKVCRIIKEIQTNQGFLWQSMIMGWGLWAQGKGIKRPYDGPSRNHSMHSSKSKKTMSQPTDHGTTYNS